MQLPDDHARAVLALGMVPLTDKAAFKGARQSDPGRPLLHRTSEAAFFEHAQESVEWDSHNPHRHRLSPSIRESWWRCMV